MRVLMTMFGWADAGGGTIFPRLVAKALRARGHDVGVLYAAVEPLPGRGPYTLREYDEDGVRLYALHNRPVPFLDAGDPGRELHDPEVVRRLRAVLAAFRPDVVHFHNFLGLSLGIAAAVHEAGVPSCYTPYNFWLACPTLYLTLPDLSVCGGVAPDGANCVRCTRAAVPGSAYVARRDRLRENLLAHVGPCLVTSTSVHDVLRANGYPAEALRLVRLANERAERLWREVGADRRPGVASPLRLGFTGSVLPIKGVHVLVAAAQRLRGAFTVHVHGDGPADYLAALRRLDAAGVVQFHGAYGDAEHARVLAGIDVGVVPSICLDHSPLVIGEWQSARVPVVGARIGGIPDYVQAEAGALVPAGDPDALAACLQRLVDEPARVVAWQEKLRPPAPFAGYVDTLEALYRELRTPQAAALPGGGRKLNLGCGSHHLPGYCNIDKFAAANPDLVMDLEQLPWPLPDDGADEVLLRHVLEHLGRDSDTFLGIMRELYRVCAPGATVRIVVPHPRHQDFLQDPTHVRPILPESFLHWSLAVNREWQAKGMPGTPLASYLGVDFAVVSVTLRLDPHWQRWLDEDPRRRSEIDFIARTHNNVVQECEIVLRAEKPFAGAGR